MVEELTRSPRMHLRWYDEGTVDPEQIGKANDAPVWRFDQSGSYLLTRPGSAGGGGVDGTTGTRDWIGDGILETATSGDVAGAQGLALVILTPKPQCDEEFNAWYDTEHVPRLLEAEGVLQAKRFVEPVEKSYVALYYLTSAEVLGSPQFKEATVRTPWTNRIVGDCLQAMEPIVSASLAGGAVTASRIGA